MPVAALNGALTHWPQQAVRKSEWIISENHIRIHVLPSSATAVWAQGFETSPAILLHLQLLARSAQISHHHISPHL